MSLVGRSLHAVSRPGGILRSLLGLGAGLLVLSGAAFRGLLSISPGEAVVLRVAGSYLGTVRRPGLWWVHPASRRARVSTRIRSHETRMLKVNDAEGNPIEIAAAVVWRVGDAARALLAVDNYGEFIRVQAEAAVRHVASGYAYDTRGQDDPSLRGNPVEVNQELSAEIAVRVADAGVTVIEARLTRLAFAPEIAQAMLRVQQANAVVAARHRIVEGAVGMVELALDRLSRDAVIDLDEERKAAMAGNLLVVLCSDHDPQPVVNSGTLY
ncbi:MAG TPA: SPFH domain-containing protein [Candidatus Micrarchaeia archaeon]|nr:SPFH domain-containing protein [Candidatus Micrarchaeia archaeon]